MMVWKTRRYEMKILMFQALAPKRAMRTEGEGCDQGPGVTWIWEQHDVKVFVVALEKKKRSRKLEGNHFSTRWKEDCNVDVKLQAGNRACQVGSRVPTKLILQSFQADSARS